MMPEVERRVNELMTNEEVTDKKGVYEYILSGDKWTPVVIIKNYFNNYSKR